MNRKLQVFVSSTFVDMKVERQAAVQAILEAGHIPAGMELFAANDESQLDTIRKWIDQSDVFLLILGGRYGSMHKKLKKSYIHLEYEYAVDQKKRFFAIVMNEAAIKTKAATAQFDVLEVDHPDMLRDFRAVVKDKNCSFFDDLKDIQLAVFKSMSVYRDDPSLSGWVPGNEVVNPAKLIEELTSLQAENAKLSRRLAEVESSNSAPYNGETFANVLDHLISKTLDLTPWFEKTAPPESGFGKWPKEKVPLLSVFLYFEHSMSVGADAPADWQNTRSTYFALGSVLRTFGLVSLEGVGLTRQLLGNTTYYEDMRRFVLTDLGARFLREVKSNSDVMSQFGLPVVNAE